MRIDFQFLYQEGPDIGLHLNQYGSGFARAMTGLGLDAGKRRKIYCCLPRRLRSSRIWAVDLPGAGLSAGCVEARPSTPEATCS